MITIYGLVYGSWDEKTFDKGDFIFCKILAGIIISFMIWKAVFQNLSQATHNHDELLQESLVRPYKITDGDTQDK